MSGRFPILLWGVATALRYSALRYPSFKTRLMEKDVLAQIKTQDELSGRWYRFKNGRLKSRAGVHPSAQVCLTFRTAEIGAKLLTPPLDHQQFVNAAKAFNVEIDGPEELSLWFMETLRMIQTVGGSYGTAAAGDEVRYVNNTNGGPVFVYVKDGKIIRITPIEFDDSEDAPSWSVKARGRTFTPPRRTTIAPHALASKSVIYSKDRLLYPLKRVDFDPNGNRNCGNRGKSGYERISWEEALDIVAGEIQRVRRKHGKGAMLSSHSSHHTWGNVGYYISANFRFMNTIGHTKMVINPDSWEGWYWGAMHHYGHSMRNGAFEPYGQVQDCLENCEMIVFWSSDPESSSGSYAAFEGTIRRQWAISTLTLTTQTRSLAVSGFQYCQERAQPWPMRSLMCGSMKAFTTRNTSPCAQPDLKSGALISWARRMAQRRPRNGRNRRQAYQHTWSERWPENGVTRKLILLRVVKVLPLVAPVVRRLVRNGLVLWSA